MRSTQVRYVSLRGRRVQASIGLSRSCWLLSRHDAIYFLKGEAYTFSFQGDAVWHTPSCSLLLAFPDGLLWLRFALAVNEPRRLWQKEDL